MIDPKLTNEMKRHIVIVILRADYEDLEITCFLRVARSFVHKICKDIEKENDDVMSLSKYKKHSTCSDICLWLPPDMTWHSFHQTGLDPKVDYSGVMGG